MQLDPSQSPSLDPVPKPSRRRRLGFSAALFLGMLVAVALTLALSTDARPASLSSAGPPDEVPQVGERARQPLGQQAVQQATVTPTTTLTVSPTATPAVAASPSAALTGTRTATPTLTAAARATISATFSATLRATGTLTGTPAISTTPTITATGTITPGRPTRPRETPSPAPSPTPGPIAGAFLPYLSNAASQAPPRPRTWGMQFAMEYDALRHTDNVLLELPRAHAAGVRSVRTDLRWMDVEPENREPEDFDWHLSDTHLRDYAAAGFDSLVTVIAYPRWAMEYSCGGGILPGMEEEWRSFIRAAALRYSQPPYDVVAWEIGNEVDGTMIIDERDRERPPEWGRGEPTTPHGGCWAGRERAYVDFLRMAHDEIKAVDPDARVTHGGLAYVDPDQRPPEVQAANPPDFDIRFLDRMLLYGGCEVIDFVGYHWFLDYPWQPPGHQRHAEVLRSMRLNGCRKAIWITETYRLNLPEEPATERSQVRFLTREVLDVLVQPEVERIYWYGWVDFPKGIADEETTFQRGLVNRDRSPKRGLQVLPQTIAHTNGIAQDISNAEVQAWKFAWPRSGSWHVIAWSKRPDRAGRLILPVGRLGREAGVRARLFTEAALDEGRCCELIRLPVQEDDTVHLEVGGDSIFVTVGDSG